MEDSKLNWYALKVFFGKVFEYEARLGDMGLETYIPVRKDLLKGEDHMSAMRRLATPDDRRRDNQFEQAGPLIYKRVPVVSSLLFVRAPKGRLKEIEDCIKDKGFVYKTADRKTDAVIPDKQMADFIRVSSSGDERVVFLEDTDYLRSVCQRVRVAEGKFAGVEGFVKRIKNNRCVVVRLEGIAAVAILRFPVHSLIKL